MGKRRIVLFRIIVLCGTIAVFILINLLIVGKRNASYGEFYSENEFVKTIDCAPYFDENPTAVYNLYFEARGEKAGEVRVYLQNGDGAKYYFSEYIVVEDSYKEYSIEIKPELIDESIQEAYLAFYGGYGSGIVPRVRNIEIKKVKEESYE